LTLVQLRIAEKNFAQVLPIVRESINGAEFIGFDTEFSGN
jgi:hypothetical protein